MNPIIKTNSSRNFDFSLKTLSENVEHCGKGGFLPALPNLDTDQWGANAG